ncbi:hypothetical protein BGW36DRAFT_411425 [Talaromyces proteolyticus]|uniref:Mid2 domain-containing protein n=1 Tax=Talaromyces proteolyticus TaxID=1131652 RepID=A0AAD4KL04_9EURO|nr:uncharacterized protein BGW36DRAFT_411425 [Talaromyces proteolyticus]KAH8690601.1 hypothetical protein BGW36DRAFT_411425 [Talaromyces proteolyticus]
MAGRPYIHFLLLCHVFCLSGSVVAIDAPQDLCYSKTNSYIVSSGSESDGNCVMATLSERKSESYVVQTDETFPDEPQSNTKKYTRVQEDVTLFPENNKASESNNKAGDGQSNSNSGNSGNNNNSGNGGNSGNSGGKGNQGGSKGSGSSGSSGLSTGAKASIGVGVGLGAIGIIAGIVTYFLRYRNRIRGSQNGKKQKSRDIEEPSLTAYMYSAQRKDNSAENVRTPLVEAPNSISLATIEPPKGKKEGESEQLSELPA